MRLLFICDAFASAGRRIEGVLDRLGVANVALNKMIAQIVGDRRERGEIAGVGQLVENEESVRGFANNAPGDGGANETGRAGH